jgi:VanZ family protein
MRKNLICTLFAVYFLTLLIAEWWPFNFRYPSGAKSPIESYEPMLDRHRWHLEKDVLKLAVFIPIGIFFVVAGSSRLAAWRVIARAVLIGAGLSILMQAGHCFLPGRSVGLTDVVMNTSGALLGASVVFFPALSRRILAGLTLACVLCFVLAATWPCRFSLEAASIASLSARVEWSPFQGDFSFETLRERALNGLMMMPLGLLGATYALRNSAVRRALIFTTLLGLGSSVWVELLQCFLPDRTPSLSDISLNTLGTLAGGIVAVYLDRWGTTHSRP